VYLKLNAKPFRYMEQKHGHGKWQTLTAAEMRLITSTEEKTRMVGIRIKH
jgi:hypothetical protein